MADDEPRKLSLGERQLLRGKRKKPKPQVCGNLTQPNPKDYVDALVLHLEGKWPPRQLTTLEWATLAFMGLHAGDGGDVYDAYDDSPTSAAQVVPGRPNEWHTLEPVGANGNHLSLLNVLPPSVSVITFMNGLEKLFLVERRLPPGSGAGYQYRLTPFGHTYLGPTNRALSEPTTWATTPHQPLTETHPWKAAPCRSP